MNNIFLSIQTDFDKINQYNEKYKQEAIQQIINICQTRREYKLFIDKVFIFIIITAFICLVTYILLCEIDEERNNDLKLSLILGFILILLCIFIYWFDKKYYIGYYYSNPYKVPYILYEFDFNYFFNKLNSN